MRNIVSLRVSQDLFDDLSDHPADWDAATRWSSPPAALFVPGPAGAVPSLRGGPLERRDPLPPSATGCAAAIPDGSFGVWYGADSIETTVHGPSITAQRLPAGRRFHPARDPGRAQAVPGALRRRWSTCARRSPTCRPWWTRPITASTQQIGARARHREGIRPGVPLGPLRRRHPRVLNPACCPTRAGVLSHLLDHRRRGGGRARAGAGGCVWRAEGSRRGLN